IREVLDELPHNSATNLIYGCLHFQRRLVRNTTFSQSCPDDIDFIQEINNHRNYRQRIGRHKELSCTIQPIHAPLNVNPVLEVPEGGSPAASTAHVDWRFGTYPPNSEHVISTSLVKMIFTVSDQETRSKHIQGDAFAKLISIVALAWPAEKFVLAHRSFLIAGLSCPL